MVIVRPYEERDFEAVKRLHARQGIGYELPDLTAMDVQMVSEENGVLDHAVFARKAAECFWIFDPQAETKRKTVGKFLMLERELNLEAGRKSLPDLYGWIPPQISMLPQFDRLMLRLGWDRPLWTCYHRSVREG